MTSFELGNLVRDRFEATGLSQHVDDAREQYLEFPDGFFAEVVLKDGAKLSEAQSLVNSIEEELSKRGVELSAIVRELWEVVGVDEAPLPPPGLVVGQHFIATLRSGARECKVRVIMTGGTSGMVYAAFKQGGLREYGADVDDVRRQIVAKFLRLELSYGGESSWDPLLRPELELNVSALEYLTSPSPVKAG